MHGTGIKNQNNQNITFVLLFLFYLIKYYLLFNNLWFKSINTILLILRSVNSNRFLILKTNRLHIHSVYKNKQSSFLHTMAVDRHLQ